MSHITVYPEQSNTKQGFGSYPAVGSLAGKESRLAVLGENGLSLPPAANSLALHVVLGQQTNGNWAAQSLIYDGNIRVRTKGTGKKGDVLILAASGDANADLGKVRSQPDVLTAGQYFSPGIADENFVDGQLAAVRPLPRMIHAANADSLTALTFTGGGATGPEVEALRDALLAILQTQALVVPPAE